MKVITICEICHQNAEGKNYDFHYGQFLGNTDVVHGGPGSFNKWTEHYRILGNCSCFFCDQCVRREYWKNVFKKPKIHELDYPWYTSDSLFIALIFGFALAFGLVKLVGLFGLTLGGDAGLYFFAGSLIFGIIIAFIASKLISYSQDFGIDIAYRMKLNDLPKLPNLVCIPPGKYKLLNSSATARRR
jgi:hypothetical protein